MGKTSRWFKGFLTGKKEKEKSSQNSSLSNKSQSSPIPTPAPKEKKRWSFRRSVGGAGKEVGTTELSTLRPKSPLGASEAEVHQKTHAMALAAAADATMEAVQAASVVIRLSTASRNNNDNNNNKSSSTEDEEAAAIKIQAVFRSYLARKALRALKGLVKLQALVRGHLVRKQATATLRCMQALVTAQARARAQRLRTVEEAENIPERQFTRRRPPSPKKPKHPNTYDLERDMEDNVKIVEMDLGETKGSTWNRKKYSIMQSEAMDHKLSLCYNGSHVPYKTGHNQQVSPSPVALSDMSPRAGSSHFEEFSFNTVQSNPHYYSAVCRPNAVKEQLTAYQQDDTFSVSNDHTYHPNYMANTESSRAKARSQSAPKQRPETCQRQSSRRRPSVEGRNIPRTKMQRSSSQVGTMNNDYHYPWSIKLDKSNASFKGSECDSTSTVLTNIYYCKSAAAYDVTHEKHKIRAYY